MQDAQAFMADARFIWHQRFELSDGAYTPGVSDVNRLYEIAQIPRDLDGLSVLDIGTTNGGAAFEAERRGARRVLAVDIFSPRRYGFSDLKDFLGSEVEYMRQSAYSLASAIDESFDIVLFWGVLYHLRHPLLALDNLRVLTRGTCYIETAVADHELAERSSESLIRFYRGDELNGDGSNWFAPSIAGLRDWGASAGFEPEVLAAWPEEAPARSMMRLTNAPGEPEFVQLSYERPFGELPVEDNGEL